MTELTRADLERLKGALGVEMDEYNEDAEGRELMTKLEAILSDLSDDSLDAHPRCPKTEMTHDGRAVRRCVRDHEHVGGHEFGSWCLTE